MESRAFQLDVIVNDTEYKGPDKSLILHFNVSILPINIQFSNVTYNFRIHRNAAIFSQVRMDYCFVALWKKKYLVWSHLAPKCVCK